MDPRGHRTRRKAEGLIAPTTIEKAADHQRLFFFLFSYSVSEEATREPEVSSCHLTNTWLFWHIYRIDHYINAPTDSFHK
jgi:hypothetical protein